MQEAVSYLQWRKMNQMEVKCHQKSSRIETRVIEGINHEFHIRQKRVVQIFENGQLYEGFLKISSDRPTIKPIYVYRCYACPSSILDKLRDELSMVDTLMRDRPRLNSIVKFQGYHYSPENIAFYLYFQHVQEIKLLKKAKKSLSQIETLNIIKEINRAFCYFEENNLPYRDITPDNILITKNMQVKIWDIGILEGIEKVFYQFKHYLPVYKSPEQFLDQKYQGQQHFAWSLGVILFELIQKQLPFKTKPIRAKKKEFVQEMKTVLKRISKFGVSELERSNAIRECWADIYKLTFTEKDFRTTCRHLQQHLDSIEEKSLIHFHPKCQKSEQNDLAHRKHQNLQNEIPLMFRLFLSQHSDIRQQFYAKLELMITYICYKQFATKTLPQSRKKEQLNSPIESPTNIDEESQKKELFEVQLNKDKMMDEAHQQVQHNQKQKVKIKFIEIQTRQKISLIEKQIQEMAEELLRVMSRGQLESTEENVIKMFLKGVIEGNESKHFISTYLEERIQEAPKDLNESKALLCLKMTHWMRQGKDFMKFQKRNLVQSLKLLRYAESIQTIYSLEEQAKYALMVSQSEVNDLELIY